MSSINHPNIVQFIGASLDPPRVGIVMEFCENGEIIHFYKKFKVEEKEINYPILEKLRMMLEISSSFDYLHSREIIHRDLKSENVLLDIKERTKLMDFGLSKLVDRMSQAKTTRIGTAVYMAPEIINNANYNEKCDVFSFAILIYIMITEDEMPYGKGNDGTNYGIEFKVSNDSSFRPKLEPFETELWNQYCQTFSEDSLIFQKFSKWIVDIITKCWDNDSENRYSMEELCTKFIKMLEEMNKMKNPENSNSNDSKSLENILSPSRKNRKKEPEIPSKKSRVMDKEVVVVEYEEEKESVYLERIKELQNQLVFEKIKSQELENKSIELEKRLEKYEGGKF